MDEENKFFTRNGRLKIPPCKSDRQSVGADFFSINYYYLGGVYTYSINAKIQKRIYTRYANEKTEVCLSLLECQQKAKKELKNFCDLNHLKKAYSRLVEPCLLQLDLDFA